MREDNLLCLRKRKFVVTTDSDHGLPVYANLVPALKLRDIDQLWVADLTYIRPAEEFVYLAVILDAFSRRVIGWALGRTLEAVLTLGALRMALAQRRPKPGLVHHTPIAACSTPAASTRNYLSNMVSIPVCHEKVIPGIMRRASRLSRPSSTKRSTAANIAISLTFVPVSAGSWKKSTTKNACTPRSVTCPRRSSSAPCTPKAKRRPLRGTFPYEFYQAWGNLSFR